MSFHPRQPHLTQAMKSFFAVLSISFAILAVASAQTQPTGFEIVKVNPELIKTPDIPGGPAGKGKGKSQSFLAIDVIFSWQPREPKPPLYLDEVTVNYYVLLNNKGMNAEDPKAQTLLTGSVTHVSMPQSKELKSVIFVSPRTLEKFFNGKVPPTVNNVVVDAGATITHGDEVVATGGWKADLRGKTPWWTEMTATSGLLLNKNQTPFAPLFWDFYEEIKSTGN